MQEHEFKNNVDQERLKRHTNALEISSLRENCIGAIKLSLSTLSKKTWVPRIVRFVNKYMFKFGFGAALNRYDSSLTFFNSKSDSRLYKQFDQESIFCNFGSGAFNHPRWKSFDYPAQSKYYKALLGRPGIDFLPIDLCVENLVLPFNNESVSLIYCSHTLEHLEESKALHFLSECARILRPDGVMRIVVPCTDNNFFLSKVIYEQKNVSKNEKEASILSSAHYLFGHIEQLKPDDIVKDVLESNFEASSFMKKAVKERGISNMFNGLKPESHITHWSHSKFASHSEQLGFKYYLPMYLGSSTVDPFCNTNVFDTTEPHISLYGELIKNFHY